MAESGSEQSQVVPLEEKYEFSSLRLSTVLKLLGMTGTAVALALAYDQGVVKRTDLVETEVRVMAAAIAAAEKTTAARDVAMAQAMATISERMVSLKQRLAGVVALEEHHGRIISYLYASKTGQPLPGFPTSSSPPAE